MPFIPLTPPSRIYTFEDLPPKIKPQHQQLIYSDPQDGFPQRLTIYAGEILIGEHDSTFQYPLLGFFTVPSGGTAIGILPINFPPSNQFRSAVANVTIIDFGIKIGFTIADVEGSVSVSSVAADLFQVELNPRQIINAVVLSGLFNKQLSGLYHIGYRVSVLERLTQNPPPQPPILIAPGGWSGKYNLDASGTLGPLLASAIPQN